tara:strand:- start:12791 stop:13090 length:300 start_codon:yes stop_codon:yes gene_type:complete
MKEDYIFLFGWYSSIAYSIYLIPQIIKTFRVKSVDDLSIISLCLILSAGISRLIYLQAQTGLLPIKVNNTFNVLSTIILISLYVKYYNNKNKSNKDLLH